MSSNNVIVQFVMSSVKVKENVHLTIYLYDRFILIDTLLNHIISTTGTSLAAAALDSVIIHEDVLTQVTNCI